MLHSVVSEHVTITPEPLAKQGILGLNNEQQNYDKSTHYMPRQCLRDGMKALILLSLLDGSIEFTHLEDRIGIVRTGKAWDKSYVFFLGFYVSIYYLKNQITYDKL